MSDSKFLKILKAIFSRSTVEGSIQEVHPAIADQGIFVFEEDGFIYPFKSGSAKIKWAAIERLEGYKRDQWTRDEISIDITWDGWKATFTEGMPGWKELLNKIKEKFPTVPADWEKNVMLPAFATNYTLLYEREDRKMPTAGNFHSYFENIDRMRVQEYLEERGWRSRKESETCKELVNSWTEWLLEEDGYGLLLHGLVAYHPQNVAELEEIFNGLGATYKFEFYDDQNQLILEKSKTYPKDHDDL